MGTANFVQVFREGLEFTPVVGRSNVFVIHLRRAQLAQEEMMSEDWDKFEKNIRELRAR